jgi:propanol-preferring alcohol dehydrogenase
MRAVRIVAVGQPLENHELEPVEPGPLEVVVEVRAAGICHSDVHYRRGPWTTDRLPLTLGHEVAGVITAVGSLVDPARVGERVCLHYQTSCGTCPWCARGSEQFCREGRMLGKGFDGGYAELVVIPGRNAFRLPDAISFEHGAVMMCSSATSLHALRKGRLAPGETVAVFGVGGLGMSAVQIAAAVGAGRVFAVDLDPAKLALAERFGAIPVAGGESAAEEIRRAGGADVALDLAGVAATVEGAIAVLRPLGRAVMVGISDRPISLVPFTALAPREAEVIGCTDHLAREIPLLLDLAIRRRLVLDDVVTAAVPLEAASINAVMDDLERYRGGIRTVITP